MIAPDTNVIVRFLVNDDAAQARRARTLIEDNEVFIPPTVLLESEWVLRSAYGFSPDEISAFICALLGLSSVSVGDRGAGCRGTKRLRKRTGFRRRPAPCL